MPDLPALQDAPATDLPALQDAPATDLPALPDTPATASSSSPDVGDTTAAFDHFYCTLPPLGYGWSDQTAIPVEQIQLCKILSSPSSSNQPLIVSHSLLINKDFTWTLHVLGHEIEKHANDLIRDIPDRLNISSFSNLLSLLDSANICPGNSQSHFVEMANSRKGTFMSANKQPVAKLEDSTIRNIDCHVLTDKYKCTRCKSYEPTLRALYSRWSHKKETTSPSRISKFTNNRYLDTPQKIGKLKSLQEKSNAADRVLKKLKEVIRSSTENSGIVVDNNLHSDLLNIMQSNDKSIEDTFPAGTFRNLFWKEQLKCAMVKDARQMRWHPTMIKWCLNLKLLSSAAYHSLRSSGFLKLPSERTLRDYTHYFKSKPGFQVEVEQMLMKEVGIDKIPEYQKYVVILFDEMKVKENIVYDKHSSHVIGFVELNDVYDKLLELEHSGQDVHGSVATHILALMVRGVFTDLRFPFAHFPTKDVAGDHLFSVIWKAIERIERLGLKVVALTADGGSPNRKFFRMHTKSSELSYRTRNVYAAEERFIYFFADVPHLMKTTRNCWSHSSDNGTRNLWVC